MIRLFNGNLKKIEMSKYNNDGEFYKNLWSMKYNIILKKQTDKDIKKKIISLIIKK